MKDTDILFIMCGDPACFAEHPFADEAEKVKMCRFLKVQGVRVNWD